MLVHAERRDASLSFRPIYNLVIFVGVQVDLRHRRYFATNMCHFGEILTGELKKGDLAG